jgi:hypothetical protein
MTGYNPYRQNNKTSSLDAFNVDNNFFKKRLTGLSRFGRNYIENVIKNSKGVHAGEDLSANVTDGTGAGYSLFSRKAYAMMQERQKVAALSVNYQQKIRILQEYATKGDIADYVSKMTNEIVIYSENNKFCELKDLPTSYSETIRNRANIIFDDVYIKSGFTDGSLAWDICRDWLVDGFLCREIVYDKRGKNIVGFLKIDPASIIPMIDEASGMKIWIQHMNDERNRRIFLDSEIIYISYSGASNYMETSYVEPLIKPYNELKSIERTRLLYNIIQATMHKEFVIPVHGLSPGLAEQEVLTLISDYKDKIAFDDTTGLIYIDGDKDLPYSKEYWFPDAGEGRPEMNIIEPGGHDINENSMLIWFKNALKQASKFPLSRLDIANNGGNIYNIGGELTHDDYNFDQYISRLKSVFKQILLKPVMLQLQLEFPELENDALFLSNIDIEFYGRSEIIKAKQLSNMQARAAIAADLRTNLVQGVGDNEKPLLHWKMIAKYVMEFDDEFMTENNKYWLEDENPDDTGVGEGGGGSEAGGDDFGGDDFGGEEASAGEEETPEDTAEA